MRWFFYVPTTCYSFQRDVPVICRMKFASLETNLSEGIGLLIYLILLFYLPDMTEILLNGTLSLNSINQTTYKMICLTIFLLSTDDFANCLNVRPGPLGYKTFFMLNSTEHEISTAHKN